MIRLIGLNNVIRYLDVFFNILKYTCIQVFSMFHKVAGNDVSIDLKVFQTSSIIDSSTVYDPPGEGEQRELGRRAAPNKISPSARNELST